jgi:hypothetical protein
MRDRAEIEADCREPSVICCATHARLLDDVPALLAALDEANADKQRLADDNERISAAWRQVVQREQRSDNAHDYDMRQVEAERDRALAALADANSERQRLRVDYRKLWAQVGPHPEPTEPGAPDDPKVLARMVIADELAERDRALAAIQRVEALCDKWASGGNWDDQIGEADIHAALAGPQDGDSA